MSCSFNYEGAILLMIQYLGISSKFHNHPFMIQRLTTLFMTPLSRIAECSIATVRFCVSKELR